MRIQQITYSIAVWSPLGMVGREVEGFALRLPAPFDDLRLCVRKDGREWLADHYPSGFLVGYVDYQRSRKAMIAALLAWLPHARPDQMARLQAGVDYHVPRADEAIALDAQRPDKDE